MVPLRTFIAVDIHPTILQSVQHKIEPLRKAIGDSTVRWVPVDNFHLTLKFLGDIAPAKVDDLTRILRTEADSCQPFDIHINGLGSFPNSKRPRVLFIGIQPQAGLDALQRGIESATAKLGYKSEARDFSPHLTIGRVRENVTAIDQQRIRKALDEIKIDSLGTARVDSVHLYKSELKPSGSVYTKLFSAPLQKP
ncbi:MAG: RNA 2',3'-cyclic phosphodiesterase [Anaerolineales bacterium]|nr:RNA 2',3'-cyclic phosphodiesterase [Anaerolineales bacterium]